MGDRNPCRPQTLQQAIEYCAWAAGGDTGASSETLFRFMTGLPTHNTDFTSFGPYAPADLDDFGRCSRLMARFPEFRPHLAKAKSISRDWARVVKNWPQLELMLARQQAGEEVEWSDVKRLLP